MVPEILTLSYSYFTGLLHDNFPTCHLASDITLPNAPNLAIATSVG